MMLLCTQRLCKLEDFPRDRAELHSLILFLFAMIFPLSAAFFAELAFVTTSHNVQAAAASATVYKGWATVYQPSLGTGACGHQMTDQDTIVAMGYETYNSYPGHTENPNKNPICGKYIKATNPKNNASVIAMVNDKCLGCGRTDLDLSPPAFAAIFDNAWTGKFDVEWEWYTGDDAEE